MSESISSCQFSEAREQAIIDAAEVIGCAALEQVDATHGSGYPLWTPGSQELSYHNGHHGRAVGDGAFLMAQAVGLDRVAQAVAKHAGRAHDIVQLRGRGLDEGASAEWLTAAMQEREVFPAELQLMGSLAILGTEPLFADGKLVGQKATEMEYPDRRTELVAKSVACGDLGELHQPQGPYLGHLLFREIKGMVPEGELPMGDLLGFQRNQQALIDNFQYPLAEAVSVLATHRPQVSEYNAQLVDKLERGTIETWDEVIRQDVAFMHQHQA
ncbi:MAG: hypothetical protein ACQR33_04800 [Candidatus Saccharibacteria bacterium]